MALGFETADWADYDVVLGASVGEFVACLFAGCQRRSVVSTVFVR